MKPVIAIDGPAASGKGTLSRKLAQVLGYAHMDTGALYRAVGLEVLTAGGDPSLEKDALIGCAALSRKLESGKGQEALASLELRREDVGDAASQVAGIQAVRDALVDIQRRFAKCPPGTVQGAVLDGRDIGTVICPEAPLKLFVTADLEIRAKRRLKELQSKGLPVTYDAVLADMRARDARDSGRKAAPLRPAEDAVVIDSSHLNEAQMLEKALECVKDAFGSDPV